MGKADKFTTCIIMAEMADVYNVAGYLIRGEAQMAYT